MTIRLGRTLGVTFRDANLLRDVGKVAIASAIAGALTLVLKSFLPALHPIIVLAISGTSFSLAYAVLMLSLRVFSFDERESLRRYVATAQRFLPWRKAEA